MSAGDGAAAQSPGRRAQAAACLRAAGVLLVGLALVAARARTPAEGAMGAAANRLLASLSADERARAHFDFEDAGRLDWHFIPRARAGLPLGALSESSRAALRALLSSALSARGLARVDGVIELEGLLRELESSPGRPADWRDPGAYCVSLFGDPGGSAPWGWRLEGHHLALNFSVVAGEASVTPAFVGANPAHVHGGARDGLRLLGAEEDLARELVASLDDEQRARAVLAPTPPDELFYGPRRTTALESSAGLLAGRLTAPQRELLARLVECYVATLTPGLADAARARLGPLEELRFTWMGGLAPGAPHYWRIDGAHALIEWDDVQDGANHVHSVWRDLERDFGLDLLARHRQAEHGKF